MGKWRRAIALCSIGNFHWTDDSSVISYRYKDNYLSFVEWKKECYIRPSYELLPTIETYKALEKIHKKGIPIALVHPKGEGENPISPETKEGIKELFESSEEMCCQPYVIVGKLLGVEL